MRKALLILLLVGASFAGGAVVNSPSLEWARAMLSHPGVIEMPGGALPPAGAGAQAGNADGTKPDPGAPPSSDARKSDGSPPRDDPGAPVPEGPEAAAPVDLLPDAPLPPALAAGPAATARPVRPRVEPPGDAGDEPRPLDPSALKTEPPTPAVAPPIVPAPPLPTPLPALSSPANPVRRASAANPGMDAPAGEMPDLPAPVSAPVTAPAPVSAPAVASPGAAGRDWATLRRKLQALGVASYRIEAEPAGRARFACVVPIAGQRSVAHHFEAEGDDEFAAAEAALRKVALWKATEDATP